MYISHTQRFDMFRYNLKILRLNIYRLTTSRCNISPTITILCFWHLWDSTRNLLLASFQVFTAVELRSPFFWNVMQRCWVCNVQLIGHFDTWRWEYQAVLKRSEPITQWRGARSQNHGNLNLLVYSGKTGFEVWSEISRTKSNYVHMQNKLTCFYNRGGECFLYGANWDFKYNPGYVCP
jgi:hypothetical protein